MAIYNPTFIFGILVLLYLSSFILFAIIRILTGISIQRIGYCCLRRIAYTPRDGVKVEIRGLGFLLHRPTFAQPTWMSIVLTELQVTLDLKEMDSERDGDSLLDGVESVNDYGGQTSARNPGSPSGKPPEVKLRPESGRSPTWERLVKAKEKIKRLHRLINWLRLVDVVATNSLFSVTDVGCIQIGAFTMAVDTRQQTVDRGRLFQHRKVPRSGQRPAEWMFTLRSVLFTPEGKESLEILDHCTLNVHGLLYKERDGLRDAAIALKLGRVHIPYDDFTTYLNRLRRYRRVPESPWVKRDNVEISLTDIMEELEMPGSREEKIVQAFSDSNEFASSILRGIKEVQFAVSFVGLSKEIHSVQPSGSPLYLNMSMKEVGIDLHRLDPHTPAHRMYFAPNDIAHQALLAAISISIGVDDGRGGTDRLIYLPMVTMTSKTTLPAKSLQVSEDKDAAERNANVLFANMVFTSPSIDLKPKHLPLFFAFQHTLPKPPTVSSKGNLGRSHIISRLLPKSSIKLSVHEPVVRIVLPCMEPEKKGTDDFDLLISSISSISLDIESSHSAAGDLHYSLASNFRVSAHQLYYQTASGARHDLLLTETLELRVQLSASPEIHVVATGNFQTFSIHMIRPEISQGVRQIVRQLRKYVRPEKAGIDAESQEDTFMRRMPSWLLQFSFVGRDFGVEVAGIDPDISEKTRGVALQLESWTAEYRAQRTEPHRKPQPRRRAPSLSLVPDEPLLNTPHSKHKRQQNSTDGRRLAIHIRGLEGFIVESMDTWEPEPFLSLPRFEVSLLTSSDSEGPVLHVSSHIKTLILQYSLYRHYAIGVATLVLKEAFVLTHKDVEDDRKAKSSRRKFGGVNRLPTRLLTDELTQSPVSAGESITLDVKASFVQIKANMPSDPPMMLQIYALDAGRHRWAAPFIGTKLLRLYAEAPKIKRVWARIVSIKHGRVDFREGKRQIGDTLHDERSIDFSSHSVRLAVPHQLVVHQVFDNFVNTAKSVQQLHHRFLTGTNEYILEKGPEGPKTVPKISIRSRALLFELEDSAFEWKLGTIYRLGLAEQKQRLAREEAFNVKVKKMEEFEQRREPSRLRARSTHPRGRSQIPTNVEQRLRSKSNEEHNRKQAPSRPSIGGRCRMRYDPDRLCALSETAKISRDEAEYKLEEHNSRSWKKVIDSGYAFQRSKMKDIREYFWGSDELPDDVQDMETTLAIPPRPGLMAALISDVHIVLDTPSFPIRDYSTFLHEIGKGMPRDMKYSLLVPLGIKVDMGEARINLRDYPLPLIHVPSMRPSQFSRTPSLSLTADFIIAEEFRDSQSTRIARVNIVPPDEPGRGGFAINVRRTVSPVKTYSDFNIDINTSYPTRITWGTSYQPAIQDMMLIIETFTKPQVDPSDRTGFWDKIRLVFHSRFKVAWKGDGDVHLLLKGSRDPYVITGHGAGFAMCWRNDVRWNLCQDPDPRKFMTVDSGEYILAIPDFSHQARKSIEESGQDAESISSSSSSSSYKNGALFKKVVMKLSGNVRWLAGLVFERKVDDNQRSFDFTPHYEVTLRSPEHAKPPNGQEYDAFRGFRSDFIHLSLSIVAPMDRDWSVSNVTPSSSYNTVHLTPRFFTHFFNWWSLFSGAMSLPIRQGRLWPGIEKSSKKFGRHLATIKYSVLFSPLFMSHIYKHKDAEEYAKGENIVSATGLKVKLDSFMLDLHQRREEFLTQVKGRKEPTATSGMRINQTQLDFISADIRAVSASIAGTTAEDLKRATEDTLASYQEIVSSVDMARFTIPDNDFSWIDMDDFVELDWVLPAESNPKTKIMPLAYAPRFTYFRQTDHSDSISGETARMSPFGNEPSHFCIISQDNDPRHVQCDLVKERLQKLEVQIENHTRILGEYELETIKAPEDSVLRTQFDLLSHSGSILQNKKAFLEAMLKQMMQGLGTDLDPGNNSPLQSSLGVPESEDIDATPLADFASDFNNRFIVHNMQMKWGNSLRNIILRYIHQVSQRRGFVYYMSRRAVKFILDIVEEQSRLNEQSGESSSFTSANPSEPVFSASLDGNQESKVEVEGRIQQLLDDANKFVFADDREVASGAPKATTDNLGENIAHEFTPQNSYHVRLIAPQIQLQSEKNPKAAVLLTAKGMQLKVVQIMDKDRVADDVSGLVQRRFSADMDSVQFFVTDQKRFSTQSLSLYSGNRYGAPAGSVWPPWVPFEVMFNFETNPSGFSRVVQKTSASLRYDKYNSLRLKYNDEVTNADALETQSPENIESRIDQLWVEFPYIKAVCDSAQYYAIYIIVLDLLMYNEPLEKIRTEKLEKIMLASDFSDLRGTPEMVIRLQNRIRQLEEIKMYFQINEKTLDRQGWEQRLRLEQDLATCEDELFFMMKAITTSQRKHDDRSQNNGLLKWWLSSSEIVWHLMRESNEPLAEFQLRNAAYSRTDNVDGSNYNTMEVEDIRGLNLLPGAIYREMISPYLGETRSTTESNDARMLKVNWNMLDAIAGIPVMGHFEVNLFPLKIQLEREVGKKLFEYIFPSVDPDAPEDGPTSTIDPEDGDFLDESSFMSLDKMSDGQEPFTRAGSLELRLTPTMTLPERRPVTSSSSRTKSSTMLGLGIGEGHHFRPFKTSRSPSVRTPHKQKSNESLRMLSRKGTDRSTMSLAVSNGTSEKPKKFSLHRLGSKDQSDERSDDLTQMMSRASSYMTLAYVKVPSVVLCLSYKGKGERNFQDVHDFVFRMPVLEYRNKTWSNLDLALQLKRDVTKALISHAGAIIGNKLSHHRPSKQQQQQSRLREITSTDSPTLSGQGSPHDRSETASMHASSIHASGTEDESSSLRRSFQSERYSTPCRTESLASSSRSENASLHGSESQLNDNTVIGGSEDSHSFIHSALSRHLSQLSHKSRHKDGSANESDER